MECVFIKLNAGYEESNGTAVVYVNINEIQLFTEYKGSDKFQSSLKISGVDEPVIYMNDKLCACADFCLAGSAPG